MALNALSPSPLLVAGIQQRFLRAAARLNVLGLRVDDVDGDAEAARDVLCERNPGFAETLMGWSVPLAHRFDHDEDFSSEAMGRWYEAGLGRRARQNQGTFYTDRSMIRRLLAEPLADPRPRLLDPAMGCGAFLSEALAEAALDSPEARWDFALHALFGVDRDPLAREIAVLALWLQAGHAQGDPRLLMRNLRVGDSLLPPPDGIDWSEAFPLPMGEGGFTAVIGNPPFVNVERLDAEAKALYREAFPDLQKRFDLFVPMAARALDLTRPGGHLALVLPQAFLTQAYAEPLRRRFLAETTLLRLAEADFPGASVRTVLITARKSPAPADHRIRLTLGGGAGERDGALVSRVRGNAPSFLPQAPLSGLPEARIPSRGGQAFAIALSALERGLPLGDVAFATWGVRGVPITTFHRDQADHPTCRPMIKGDGIEPYRVRWSGKYLRYEPDELYRPLFPQLFEGEKIVLRKVSGSRGLVAALDREGYYTDDSVLCCQLRSQLDGLPEAVARRFGGRRRADELAGYDLPILLAVLNSRIGAMIFELLLGNGLNVYPGAVMRLPLPPYDAERFAFIRSLVERRRTAPPAEAENLDRILETQLAVLYRVDLMELE